VVRGPIVVACVLLSASVAPLARVAHADSVDELDKQLSSSSDKTRLSAVVALAKLNDKRALKPLVTALHDPNNDVRATAAVALGHLGHKAALPSLRDLAANDPDDTVRTKARAAAKLVARANHLPDDAAVAQAPQTDATQSPAPTRKPTGHTRSGHPDVYVVVKTSSDESPGNSDQDARKVHADIVRQALVDECGSHAQVTLAATDAQRWSLDTRQVDLSVIRLDVTNDDAGVEVDAQLRLAISDRNGKMQSFLTGGAKVSLPRAKVSSDPSHYLPQLEREALENAMQGMFDKLLAHLRKTSS
jgi:hypothetical protein